jgi:hypothetical protein
MGEQVRQAKVDTRRRIFDEWIYERAMTPTTEDNRERQRREDVRRSLTDPPLPEIWSGKALNDLLVDIQALRTRNLRGPNIPIDEDILSHINVTSGRDGGNIGLLKDINASKSLNWPLALLEPQYKDVRERIEGLTQEAVKQAMNGNISASLLRDLTAAKDKLNGQLLRSVGDLPPTQYIDAKRFLTNLDDALRVLGHPDAGQYFTKRKAARGRTVEELVQNMIEQGLQFAPAVAGDESAYNTLQRLMARYDIEAQGSYLAGQPSQRSP